MKHPSILSLRLLPFGLLSIAARAQDDELGAASKFFAGRVETIATHDEFAWLESPVWNDAGQYLLFSDVKWSNDDGWHCGMIWKYDESTSRLSKFLTCSGLFGPGNIPEDIDEWYEAGSNGMYWGWKGASSGDLLITQHGKARIARINVNDVDEESGTIDPSLVSVVVDGYNGTKLNSPNDMTIYNGDLYFTDPPFGLQRKNSIVDDPWGQAFEEAVQDPAVYRIHGGDPGTSKAEDGKVERVVGIPRTPDLLHAFNGIALNDAGEMFVAITDWEDPHFRVYAHSSGNMADGAPVRVESEYRIVNNTDNLATLNDGVTYSPGLNAIFATGPGGVYVYNATTYDLLGFVRLDDLVANNVIGGGYLWMTVNRRLMRIPLSEEAAAATAGEGQMEGEGGDEQEESPEGDGEDAMGEEDPSSASSSVAVAFGCIQSLVVVTAGALVGFV
jgi:gluconolactonase